MSLYVIREAALPAGTVSWVYLTRHPVWVVNPADVTPAGAQALADLWNHFINIGAWVSAPSKGQAIRVDYRLSDTLEEDIVARLDTRGGFVIGDLNPRHFSTGFPQAVTDAVQQFTSGFDWRYSGVSASAVA